MYLAICTDLHAVLQVGYDAGDQFSFHWWDHVFNKTAKSIVVQESKVRTCVITRLLWEGQREDSCEIA